jgi:multidrug efflux pump subunit AcrB
MGKEVEKQIAVFESALPDDVSLFRITNQPYDVNNSVVNFLTELLIAVVGVLIAIILLLPFRVAMIAASTIPITIFISLGLFYVLGIELNTVTLACLIVSLGMIVDNSVVIIDEYVDLLGQGIDRKTATLK